ncbi:hypothetical protein CC85DRAFT_271612 [Cutaneotrichosporon oleaginosum]|uniref:Uncharacterized protein n=1 Tax=Cutaneotrichosporon oleaginosum TaxID=879819 RepID=A0A0J0XSP1_9TREE|nr:uncharacterized protein CC85DRAFT_271612 [Cutaneotrichosporon oleaginosum]KLT44088.1 hypothetical protein CC85DRAFT_271612 [Cutaneotrichosporon oleaginosum]TXT09457.1 hypothetical protein COLE_03391 [Cutaneotrichosporon oleaginosum]
MDRRVALRLSLLLNVLLLAAPIYTLFFVAPAFHRSETRLEWNEPVVGNELVQVPSTPPEPVFECGISDAGPTGRRLAATFGDAALRRSVAYSGSNHRLRRVLAKMRAGEPFSMGVLGGSVSAGHGMHRSKEDEAHIMHRVLFDHLDSQFPAAEPAAEGRVEKGGKRNVYWNGAQPARGSDYFSYCSALHLNRDVDLVIVELAINDPFGLNYVQHFENLVRSLLELPSQPAVLVVNSFALSFERISMGGDLNFGNAQFYDLPVVSARNALLPLALQNHTLLTEWFASMNFKPIEDDLSNADLRHFAKPLHTVTGELMTAYIESQLCEMDRIEHRRPRATPEDLYPVEPVPRVRLQDKYAIDRDFPKLQPFCIATNSDEYPLAPIKQNGWRAWAWKDKKYLIAEEVGASLTFEFTTVLGTANLYYLRSWEFPLGQLNCWIDDDKGTAKISNGRWTNKMNIGQSTTWHGLTEGKHTLNCEIIQSTDDPSGGHEFRLMSLMTL